MRRFLFAAIVAASAGAAFAQPNVGVSVTIGQPGYYGRIDISNYPPPPVIYQQPMLVQPVAPGGLVTQPIYLRVPPEHARNWRKHCHWYGACGTPVYFVQDTWYQQVYVPRYRELHHHDNGRHEGWNNDRGYDEGRGHGHGRHGDGWNN